MIILEGGTICLHIVCYMNLVAIIASAYAANVLKGEQAYEAALALYGVSTGPVVSGSWAYLLR